MFRFAVGGCLHSNAHIPQTFLSWTLKPLLHPEMPHLLKLVGDARPKRCLISFLTVWIGPKSFGSPEEVDAFIEGTVYILPYIPPYVHTYMHAYITHITHINITLHDMT